MTAHIDPGDPPRRGRYAAFGSGAPDVLGRGLADHAREGGVPFLWDLVDALEDASDPRAAAYLSDVADALACRLGKLPPAVTLPGADA